MPRPQLRLCACARVHRYASAEILLLYAVLMVLLALAGEALFGDDLALQAVARAKGKPELLKAMRRAAASEAGMGGLDGGEGTAAAADRMRMGGGGLWRLGRPLKARHAQSVVRARSLLSPGGLWQLPAEYAHDVHPDHHDGQPRAAGHRAPGRARRQLVLHDDCRERGRMRTHTLARGALAHSRLVRVLVPRVSLTRAGAAPATLNRVA